MEKKPMPIVTAPLDAHGALVDVLLGWSARHARQLRAALPPVPPALNVRALIDTGAEITCADAALIQQLGLPIEGVAPAHVPAAGGLTVTTRHDADLIILHPSGDARQHLILADLVILDLPLLGMGYQVLLGRDVLAQCAFLYDGPQGQLQLTY